MPGPTTRRLARALRRLLRWSRITGWLVVLGALCAVLWLHFHGLPEPVKTRLQAALRSRGVEFQFSRLRLRWYRGLVAEDLSLDAAGPGIGPRFQAREAVLHLDFAALAAFKLQVTGLGVQDARFEWPVHAPGRAPAQLNLTNITAELRFLPGDRWDLRWAQARFLDLDLSLSGIVTNAPVLLQSRPAPPKPGPPGGPDWLDLLTRVRVGPQSRLNVVFAGDARAPESFHGDLKWRLAGLESPWGRSRSMVLSARVRPDSGAGREAAFDLDGSGVSTPWGQTGRIQAAGQARWLSNRLELAAADAALDYPRAAWGQARSLVLKARAAAANRSLSLASGDLSLEVRRFAAPSFEAAGLRLTAGLAPAEGAPGSVQVRFQAAGDGLRAPAQGSAGSAGMEGKTALSVSNGWPAWIEARLALTNLVAPQFQAAETVWDIAARFPPAGDPARLLEPAVLAQAAGEVKVTMARVRMPRLFDMPALALEAAWQPPLLTVRSLRASMPGGPLEASGRWDQASGATRFRLESAQDWRRWAPFAPAGARPWLEDCRWAEPPRLVLEGALGSPVWREGRFRSFEELVPGLSAAGRLELGAASLRGLEVSGLQAPLFLTNSVLTSPGLVLERPEGRLVLAGRYDHPSRGMQVRIRSGIDPRPLLNLVLPAEGREVVELLDLGPPPGLDALLETPLNDWSRAAFSGALHLTNGAFRRQTFREVHTSVAYSNQMLVFDRPSAVRAEGAAGGGSVSVNLRDMVLGLTNLSGDLDYMAVCRAVGPHVERVMKPYQFALPPAVKVNGQIGMRAADGLDDIFFDAAGGEFKWRDFRFQSVTGRVHWIGHKVLITNVTARFHGGSVSGSVAVDDAPKEGQAFSFDILAEGVDAGSFLRDVSPRTNTLEGRLSGRLAITAANTWDPLSWQGAGDASLQEGLIWKVPFFSYLSPMLDKIAPGLGSSRARQADGSFVITNSVIVSSNLVVHTSGARLWLAGSVDFDQNLNGRVEAGLFRDTPGVGWLLSTVFWPVTKAFEYKFSGTLDKPKLDPLYIPKLLFLPFQPIRTLKELTKPAEARPAPSPSRK